MGTYWRNTPPGLAFLWEQDNALPARWHRRGEGPAQYLADTPSASAAGWRVEHGLVRAPAAEGRVVVLYGRRPELVAHKAVAAGHPPPELVTVTRPLHARVPPRGRKGRRPATGRTRSRPPATAGG